MNPFVSSVLTILCMTGFTVFFFSNRMRKSTCWQATVTPLASIIGSGFLVCAPLLVMVSGKYAWLIMMGIAFIAYLLGSVMRFNIRELEPMLEKEKVRWFARRSEVLSRPFLGFAYIISVAFYLKLLSAFVLRGMNVDSLFAERCLTTGILVFIGLLGWRKGLRILESLEKYSVNIKLIVILSAIVLQIIFNGVLLFTHQWHLATKEVSLSNDSIRQILGFLIIIQGFETSRYLGEFYNREIRIKTMQYAQIISGIIYIIFIASSMILFTNIPAITETAVIDLTRIISPILPFTLVIAATMSQFSAAVADTLGSAGLISEATKKTVPVNNGILFISIIAILLTWSTSIYHIIMLASKAFAIYYAMQCIIAVKISFRLKKYPKMFLFSLLLFLMVAVVLFGIPVE